MDTVRLSERTSGGENLKANEEREATKSEIKRQQSWGLKEERTRREWRRPQDLTRGCNVTFISCGAGHGHVAPRTVGVAAQQEPKHEEGHSNAALRTRA